MYTIFCLFQLKEKVKNMIFPSWAYAFMIHAVVLLFWVLKPAGKLQTWKSFFCRYNKQTHYKSTLYAKSFLSCWMLPTMIDKNAVNMTDSIFKANAQDTQDIFWSVQQLCTLLGGGHFISCKLLEYQDFLQHEGFYRVFFQVLDLYNHVMPFFFLFFFLFFGMGSLFLGGLWAVVVGNIKVFGTWIGHLCTGIYRLGGHTYISQKKKMLINTH